MATTFKTCVLDAPCDVCGPDEALFPVEGGVYANSGICVSKTRWVPTLKLSSPTDTGRPNPLPSNQNMGTAPLSRSVAPPS